MRFVFLALTLTVAGCQTNSVTPEAADHATCAKATDYEACRARQLVYRDQARRERASAQESFHRGLANARDKPDEVVIIRR